MKKWDRRFIAQEVKAQCPFCKNIFFTKDHIEKVKASGESHGFKEDTPYIDQNGKCPDCRKIKGLE